MPFHSNEYLAFFLFVLITSWALVSFARARLLLLLLASYYFYASNNGWLLALILFSTQIDFLAAIGIENSQDQKRRKRLLLLSICVNLGTLAFFKYCDFLAGNIASAFAAVGYELDWVDLNVFLPVGISFYTFQSMSYTIDVYRGDMKAERSWTRFALFVAFFPQLVAGPIVRPQNFIPQLDGKASLSAERTHSALFLIFRGLFKKIVLGDFLAAYADIAFDSPGSVSAAQAWLGVYAFAFQIYFDFSGYSDIAIGCSRLLGYELPDNFLRPYAATGFSDFWKRWHISLSSWLRDYLYIPLGGNRMRTQLGVYRNLMLTMLLGGLWHGAAWNFVLWGFLHGLYLSVERFIGKREHGAGSLVKIFIVFHCVLLTWIAFRAYDLETAGVLLGKMFLLIEAPVSSMSNGEIIAWSVIALGWFIQVLGDRISLESLSLRQPLLVRGIAYGAVAAACIIFGAGEYRPFIYFQF